MKKAFILAGAVAIIATAGVISVNLLKSSNSELHKANIEALSGGEDSTGNTGPGEVIDCAGIGTGTKKVCKCINDKDCTESSCS